jgi:hypothetical protein
MLWSKVCHHIQGNSLSRNRLLFKQRSGVYVLLRWCLYCFCPDARRFYIDQIKPKRHSFLYLHPYIRNRIVVVSIYYLVDGSFATCCLLVEESIKNQSYQMVFLCLTFFLKESMSNLYTLQFWRTLSGRGGAGHGVVAPALLLHSNEHASNLKALNIKILGN